MSKNKVSWIFTSLILSILMKAILPNFAAGSSPGASNASYRHTDAQVEAKIEAALPLGFDLIDQVIVILAEGRDGMSAAQWQLFQSYFDPASTGDLDEDFLQTVVDNYTEIKDQYYTNLVIEFETENKICRGMQLFYTDFFKVHVCPYIEVEADTDRIARDFVHELAHIAFVAQDRAYFFPGSSEYAEMSPHGHWSSHLPVVGRIMREITLQDTLYNPDSYSEFAYALSVLEIERMADGNGEIKVEVSAEVILAASSADRNLLGN